MDISSASRSISGKEADKISQMFVFLFQVEQRVCAECLQAITDQFVLQVSGSCWHARCLRCCVCQAALDHEPSCFMRDHQVYCRADYIK